MKTSASVRTESQLNVQGSEIGMKIVKANQYRIRGNWLYFPGLDLEPIQIPFGIGLGTRRSGSAAKVKLARSRTPRPRLRLQAKGRQITALDTEVGGSWRRVLPAFSRVVGGNKRARPTFLIQTATLDAERLAALRVVERAHYLKARARGLVLLAIIQDPRSARRIRARWWAKLPRAVRARYGTLERATGGTGIVGALHLERLVHGNPLGRAAIYQLDRKRPPDGRSTRHPGFRWRVVRQLGLYWISRIAVDAPFQELGIGSALCDAAREVAATRMLEPGRYVELIRRLPIAQFEAIAGGKGDFLTGDSKDFAAALPFKLRTPYLSRKPARIWSATRGRWEPRPKSDKTQQSGDCLAYYYAKAAPMVIGRGARRARRGGLRG
jgi:GNAT superfamily N-acetyltransferase